MLILRSIQQIVRGLRFRMLVAFLLVFVSLAAASIWYLHDRMHTTFLKMERENSVRSVERVVGGLDALLAKLHAQTRDWAMWDEMYAFAKRPDPQFSNSNLNVNALNSADLMGVMLLGVDGKIIWYKNLQQSNGEVLQQDHWAQFRSVFMALLTADKTGPQCGFVKPQDVLLMVCSHRIFKTDGTGPVAGVLVLMREFNTATRLDLERQAKENITLLAGEDLHAQEWWDQAALQYLPAIKMSVRKTPSLLTVNYPLQDLTGRVIRTVRITLTRSLMEEGDAAIAQVARLIGLIAVGSGILMLFIAHFWLVVPISRLKTGLAKIHQHRAWDTILGPQRSDEIGVLQDEVNGLLQVIHTQVQDLEKLSSTDFLTGLPNRRQFDQRLAEEINRVARKPQPLSVIALDIDYFKQYNDHYGHTAGDVVLRSFAHILTTSIRRIDVPGRVGGEEFAVLLPDTAEEQAILVAEKVLKAVHKAALPHAHSKVSDRLTFSAGVATLRPGDETGKSFMQRADQALYAAKAAGRNRVLAASVYAP
jgi:diguanylate cyclase (GGDEF)-like protein